LQQEEEAVGQSESPYVTPQELAALLRVKVETVYDLAQRGEIPVAFRVGGRLRFDQEAVVAALRDADPRA